MQLNAIIEVTPAEIEKLIVDYVKKETGNRDVSSVNFSFVTVTRGIGMSERDEKTFAGATVRLTPLLLRQ